MGKKKQSRNRATPDPRAPLGTPPLAADPAAQEAMAGSPPAPLLSGAPEASRPSDAVTASPSSAAIEAPLTTSSGSRAASPSAAPEAPSTTSSGPATSESATLEVPSTPFWESSGSPSESAAAKAPSTTPCDAPVPALTLDEAPMADSDSMADDGVPTPTDQEAKLLIDPEEGPATEAEVSSVSDAPASMDLSNLEANLPGDLPRSADAQSSSSSDSYATKVSRKIFPEELAPEDPYGSDCLGNPEEQHRRYRAIQQAQKSKQAHITGLRRQAEALAQANAEAEHRLEEEEARRDHIRRRGGRYREEHRGPVKKGPSVQAQLRKQYADQKLAENARQVQAMYSGWAENLPKALRDKEVDRHHLCSAIPEQAIDPHKVLYQWDDESPRQVTRRVAEYAHTRLARFGEATLINQRDGRLNEHGPNLALLTDYIPVPFTWRTIRLYHVYTGILADLMLFMGVHLDTVKQTAKKIDNLLVDIADVPPDVMDSALAEAGAIADAVIDNTTAGSKVAPEDKDARRRGYLFTGRLVDTTASLIAASCIQVKKRRESQLTLIRLAQSRKGGCKVPLLWYTPVMEKETMLLDRLKQYLGITPKYCQTNWYGLALGFAAQRVALAGHFKRPAPWKSSGAPDPKSRGGRPPNGGPARSRSSSSRRSRRNRSRARQPQGPRDAAPGPSGSGPVANAQAPKASAGTALTRQKAHAAHRAGRPVPHLSGDPIV